jgi:hypothetical protein
MLFPHRQQQADQGVVNLDGSLVALSLRPLAAYAQPRMQTF